MMFLLWIYELRRCEKVCCIENKEERDRKKNDALKSTRVSYNLRKMDDSRVSYNLEWEELRGQSKYYSTCPKLLVILALYPIH